MGDAVADPVDVLLDRDRHIAEHGRASGPRDHEHIGKAQGGDAEISLRSGGPLRIEPLAAASANVDSGQRASECVEASRENDGVECIGLIARADSSGHDLLDGRLSEIDQFDIAPVISLEIVCVERQALGADGVLGDQLARDFRVFDYAANLFAHEVSGRFVRVLVNHQIAIAAEHPLESTFLPVGLELLAPRFGVDLERFGILPIVGLSDRRPPAGLTDLLDIALELGNALRR